LSIAPAPAAGRPYEEKGRYEAKILAFCALAHRAHRGGGDNPV